MARCSKRLRVFPTCFCHYSATSGSLMQQTNCGLMMLRQWSCAVKSGQKSTGKSTSTYSIEACTSTSLGRLVAQKRSIINCESFKRISSPSRISLPPRTRSQNRYCALVFRHNSLPVRENKCIVFSLLLHVMSFPCPSHMTPVSCGE